MDSFGYGMLALALVFIGIVVLGSIFVLRAFRSLGEKPSDGFRSVLAVQRRYDQTRKNARIPCSVLYVKAAPPEEIGTLDGEERLREVYAHVADLLPASFEGENNSIARFSATDYVILTCLGETRLTLCAEQITREMLLFSKMQPQLPKVTVHMGAYLIPAESVGFDEAVSRAKLACKQARSAHMAYLAWDYALQQDYENKAQMEEQFRTGIENSNFFLEFQPIMDISAGTVVGGEVLTRLSTASKVILPTDFVPVLQGQAMSAEFDAYILEKSCRWIAAHRETCEKLRYLSVNFSRETIAGEHFVPHFLQTLEKYAVPPAFFAVEVLEGKCEADVLYTLKLHLEELHAAGVRILLDDFGEGYTSFDDLQNYPVDIIKIGKSILDNLSNGVGMRIFKSVLHIAENLNAEVICEGVETPEQLDILRNCACKFVQGFYFYRPMNADQFVRVIQNNKEEL